MRLAAFWLAVSYIEMTSDVVSLAYEGSRRLSSILGTPNGWKVCLDLCNPFSLLPVTSLRGVPVDCGTRDGLIENMPIFPVSVVVLSMLSNALGRVAGERFSSVSRVLGLVAVGSISLPARERIVKLSLMPLSRLTGRLRCGGSIVECQQVLRPPPRKLSLEGRSMLQNGGHRGLT